MKKILYIFLGTISLVLGLLGLVTPGLPTTPFILLSGYLYARSSPHLYRKLENNQLTGMYLKGMKKGFSLKMRLLFLFIMWSMILFSVFFIFNDTKITNIMIILGIFGTISQLLFLKKKKPKSKIPINKETEDIQEVL